MRIVLLTDNRNGIPAFRAIAGSRSCALDLRQPSELTELLCSARADCFVYLDIAGLSLAAVRSRLKQLSRAAHGRFGIVDPADILQDPSEVFHKGGADYLGKRMLGKPIPTARFTRVFDAVRAASEDPVEPVVVGPANLIPSGSNWSDVEYGKEYTFQMLYVGIDHAGDMDRKVSESLLQSLRRAFQAVLEQSFAGADGRIWVWKEYDGVLLFPFDGSRLTALIPAARLALNRPLINLEHFSGMMPISWRMGLHVGNTTYRAPGETGGIVSEALNFVFHLGERALGPGELGVTGPAMAFVPPRFRAYLTGQTVFESVPFSAFPVPG